MIQETNEEKTEPTEPAKFKLVQRINLGEISSEGLRPEIGEKNAWLYPEDSIGKIEKGAVCRDADKKEPILINSQIIYID